MASLSQLIVKITAESSDFDRGVASAQRSALKFSEQLNSIGSTLLRSFTVPLGLLGGAAVKSFGDIDALRRGLEAITGSATEAARQMTQLREVAKLPGLGFKEAVQGAINLQAVGFSAKQSQTVLLQFGNALATVGRGREDLNEVIRQLGQLASRGKVTADNLKPIIERVPQVAAIIKREFGTIDTEQLQKLGISSKEFIDVLIKNLEQLPRATGGIKNEFENLRDTVDQAASKLGSALAPAVTKAIQSLDPLITGIGNAATEFAKLPDSIQRTALALGLLALSAGPISLTVAKIGELATVLGRVGSIIGGSVFLQKLLFTGIGLTSLGVGAGLFVALDKLNDFGTKGSTAEAGLAKLNARLGDFSRATAGLNTTKIDKLRESVFGVTSVSDTAAEAARKLNAAFANLGTAGPSQFNEQLKALKESLSTVQAAYKSGTIDLATLNRATEAYQKKVKELGVELNSFKRATIGNLIEVEQFNRQQTALQGAIKAITDFANAGKDFGTKLATSKAPVETFTTQLELLGRNSPEAATRVSAALQELAAIRLPVENLNEYRAAVDLRDVLTSVVGPLSPLNRLLLEEANAAIAAAGGTLQFGRVLDEIRGKTAATAVETETLAQTLERIGKVKATNVDVSPKLDTRLNESFITTEQNMRRLGVTATSELRRQADALGAALDQAVRAREAGNGSQANVEAIRAAYEKAEVAAAGLTGAVSAQLRTFKQLKTEVRGIVSGLGSDLARSIVEWKGLGNAVAGVMKDISASIITFGINSGLRLLGNELAKLGGTLGGIGKQLQDIFGTAGRTAGAVSQGAGAAGGGASSAAGAIGSAASAGLAGAISAVTGVVSAVFDVLQFTQLRRMEQDLGRVEVTTRGQLNQLISIQGSLNQWLPFLNNTALLASIDSGIAKIYQGLSEVSFINGGAGNGGGGSTFANCSFTFQLAPGTPEETLRQVARHLKLRDRAFAGA